MSQCVIFYSGGSRMKERQLPNTLEREWVIDRSPYFSELDGCDLQLLWILPSHHSCGWQINSSLHGIGHVLMSHVFYFEVEPVLKNVKIVCTIRVN